MFSLITSINIFNLQRFLRISQTQIDAKRFDVIQRIQMFSPTLAGVFALIIVLGGSAGSVWFHSESDRSRARGVDTPSG